MTEGEGEEETLIQASDLQTLGVDARAGQGDHTGPPSPGVCVSSLLQPPSPPGWKLPLHCFALVIVTAALVILMPVYLEVVNKSGDAYSALLFTSFFSCLPTVLYIQIRYSYFCQLSRLGPPAPCRIIKIGAIHGLSLLMIVYALDRKRIVCHAQEPLMGLVVMYMIIIYFFYKGPELSSSKMFALCGVLSGLFLAVDFQLNDKYRCHGGVIGPGDGDGSEWSLETHSLWTIVYATALFLFTLSWLLLEREVLTKKYISGSGRLIPTVSGRGAGMSDREALMENGVTGVLPSGMVAVEDKWGVYLVWFTLASFATIVLFLWTDFFTALGKAGSPHNFLLLTSRGWQCHFHCADRTCGPIPFYGWSIVVLYTAFLWLLGRVMSQAGSMVFTLATTSLALPLQALWWAMFEIGGPGGMHWNPKVTGELIFSLLGFPVMVTCLGFWIHADRRASMRTDNLLLT